LARRKLKPFDAQLKPRFTLGAVLQRDGQTLIISYWLNGDIQQIDFPPFDSVKRGHKLWENTCFEFFLLHADGRYMEWNFSPSGAWACYAFSDYRSGMTLLTDAAVPHISFSKETNFVEAFAMHVSLPMESFLADGFDQASISAVLEQHDGKLSYWALAHAPDKPDFHHPDCFVLSLKPETNL
jgi:hypothetical protein